MKKTFTSYDISLLPSSVAEGAKWLQQYIFSRPLHYSTFYDFNAWVYSTDWSEDSEANKGSSLGRSLNGRCSLVVDDIKFSFNAWSLLRLGMYYNTAHPRVLTSLQNTTPSMAIDIRGNRLFYEYCHVNSKLNPNATKVALMPSHPNAQLLHEVDWKSLAAANTEGVEIVLGMENGMRSEVCESCDAWISLPQFGSIGSLSMMAAMAIATHAAHSALCPYYSNRKLNNSNDCTAASGEKKSTEFNDADNNSGARCTSGNVVAAEIPRNFSVQRPHNKELLGLNDISIGKILEERRKEFPLQLGILWHNECADRNIGATIRNGNVYNIEKMIVLNRRKFSRRGTVGTHHYLNLIAKDNINDAEADIDGYVCWALHQDYPYLVNHLSEINPAFELPQQLFKKKAKQSMEMFQRHDSPLLQRWLAAQRVPFEEHPMYGVVRAASTSHLAMEPVYLDDITSLRRAVRSVKDRGYKGIMLVIPEEGATSHWHLLQRCERVVFVVRPEILSATQRGLTAGISTAIALERIRMATLELCE